MTRTVAIALAFAPAGSVIASVDIAVGSGAPTHSTTLSFDEPGGPTGSVPSDSWSGIGISSLLAGAGEGFVADLSGNPGFGWLPQGNVLVGSFGVFFEFSTGLTDFSAQVWDNAGPASFLSGGMLCSVENDGVEVVSFFWENPVYGTTGDNWFNISATDGMEFDRIAFVGFAFVAPETIVDSVSFNVVPAPGAMGLLLPGVCLAARRRRG